MPHLGVGSYAIRGGRADADRLSRQAEVMAAATSEFLASVGLASGWICIDVGCGNGTVTLEMARIAGPKGRVVGLDLDTESLQLGREAAEREGLGVEFVEGDCVAPFERDAFDLAYARLVLSHLRCPVKGLAAMRDSVRPGGIVAVEDLKTDSSGPTHPSRPWCGCVRSTSRRSAPAARIR